MMISLLTVKVLIEISKFGAWTLVIAIVLFSLTRITLWAYSSSPTLISSSPVPKTVTIIGLAAIIRIRWQRLRLF